MHLLLAQTVVSIESIAYLLALAAVLFFQQRAAAQAKLTAEEATKARVSSEKAEVELKAIKATADNTNETLVVVHKLSNGALGAALKAVAVSARILADHTKLPQHAHAADEAEFAAAEHDRREKEAGVALEKRSEAVAVANAKATAPVDVAAAADHVAEAAVEAAATIKGKTP